jgi:serine/threonine protein kinase
MLLDVGGVVANEYRVLGLIGGGGTGYVFEVEQQSTGARRALKVIRPELLRDDRERERFRREALHAARIESDHVVSVIAAGVHKNLDGQELLWIALEYAKGPTLEQEIRSRGPFDRTKLSTVSRQVAHALHAAHLTGIVHRDLTPNNVIITHARRPDVDYTVKLLDFGIAKDIDDTRMTLTNQSLGTAGWMAPEQVDPQNRKIGPWTDVWTFGLLVQYMLTGCDYSAAGSGIGLERPSSIARRSSWTVIPSEGFDDWFLHCVCRDHQIRFQSVWEAAEHLSAITRLDDSNDGAKETPKEDVRAGNRLSEPTQDALTARTLLGAVSRCWAVGGVYLEDDDGYSKPEGILELEDLRRRLGVNERPAGDLHIDGATVSASGTMRLVLDKARERCQGGLALPVAVLEALIEAPECLLELDSLVAGMDSGPRSLDALLQRARATDAEHERSAIIRADGLIAPNLLLPELKSPVSETEVGMLTPWSLSCWDVMVALLQADSMSRRKWRGLSPNGWLWHVGEPLYWWALRPSAKSAFSNAIGRYDRQVDAGLTEGLLLRLLVKELGWHQLPGEAYSELARLEVTQTEWEDFCFEVDLACR